MQPTSTKPITSSNKRILVTHTLLDGQVIAAYGKRYDVELSDGNILSCVTRGKKTDLACGDQVLVKSTSAGEGVVEEFKPRDSLLYRSNTTRTKLLAANVTQIVFVLAAKPSFYEELLNRCLLAAEAAGIRMLIVLNKADLPETAEVMPQLALFQKLGYEVLPLSAKQDAEPLKTYLHNHTSVLVGQSGMGKSTLVNALLPDEDVRTREISDVLDSGKHTTTATRLYHLDTDSHLIDSPGLQEFGLAHLSLDDVERGFIEFRPYLGKCRFNNCRHLKEPDCAILNAVEQGNIATSRLLCYHGLVKELTAQHALLQLS